MSQEPVQGHDRAPTADPGRLLPPRRYLVGGVLLFLLVGAGGVLVEARFLRDVAVSLAERDGKMLAEHLSSHYIRPGVFLDAAGGLAIPTPLPEDVRAEIRSLGISKLKLYDLEGRIVASTAAEEVGLRVEGNRNLELALSGRVAGHVASRSYYRSLYGRASEVALLEVYVPFWFPAGTMPAGVFEIYRPWSLYEPIVRRGIFRTAAVAGALALVFGAGLLLIHRHLTALSRRIGSGER